MYGMKIWINVFTFLFTRSQLVVVRGTTISMWIWLWKGRRRRCLGSRPPFGCGTAGTSLCRRRANGPYSWTGGQCCQATKWSSITTPSSRYLPTYMLVMFCVSLVLPIISCHCCTTHDFGRHHYCWIMAILA